MKLLVQLLLLFFLFESPALAYLDPVSLSGLFAAILAGIAATVVNIKKFVRKFFSFFKKKTSKKN